MKIVKLMEKNNNTSINNIIDVYNNNFNNRNNSNYNKNEK